MAKYSTRHSNQGIDWRNGFRVLAIVLGKNLLPLFAYRGAPGAAFNASYFTPGYYRGSFFDFENLPTVSRVVTDVRFFYHSRAENMKICPLQAKSIPRGFWRPGSIWSRQGIF